MNGGTTFNGNVTINSSTTTSSFLSISSQTGNSIAIGRGAVANGGNSIAIGNVALINGFTNSVAIGAGASCTANNQIMIGTARETVVINGNLYVNASRAVSQTLASFIGFGGGGVSYNFDFCAYINNSGTPTNRIACIDDGAFSGHYVFYSKTPGSDSNPLVERMRISSNGTVSIPGSLINSSPVHIEFINNDANTGILYYNSTGTAQTAANFNQELYIKFTVVRVNKNWGTPVYLKNAGLYVPYTGVYYIMFTSAGSGSRENFISKNGMGGIDINNVNVLLTSGGINMNMSMSATTFLNANEYINFAAYFSGNSPYGVRTSASVTLIHRTS